MSGSLIENSYGKSRVRVSKVIRNGDWHEIKELTVDIQLQGAFERSYLEGDNSQILPTDSMKNTVYALAASHSLDTIESFSRTLADHFLDNFAHVSSVSVTIAQDRWDRIPHNGKEHEHAFTGGNSEKRVTHIDVTRGDISVESGIEGLQLLKTTRSGFAGYIKDQYTTLPETNDRIFATTLVAHWLYRSADEDFDGTYQRARKVFLDIFSQNHSLAVQQTLYQMADAALDACPEIEEIRLEMPNQHRIPFDMTRIGLQNKNEIFIPIDEPFGLISAVVTRNK